MLRYTQSTIDAVRQQGLRLRRSNLQSDALRKAKVSKNGGLWDTLQVGGI